VYGTNAFETVLISSTNKPPQPVAGLLRKQVRAGGHGGCLGEGGVRAIDDEAQPGLE